MPDESKPKRPLPPVAAVTWIPHLTYATPDNDEFKTELTEDESDKIREALGIDKA